MLNLAQAARGAPVHARRWADSPHVGHYRQHPHEYALEISRFLAHALSDWTEEEEEGASGQQGGPSA
jgi:hypothetical protein